MVPIITAQVQRNLSACKPNMRSRYRALILRVWIYMLSRNHIVSPLAAPEVHLTPSLPCVLIN